MFSRFASYFYYEFYFLGTKYFLENILGEGMKEELGVSMGYPPFSPKNCPTKMA